MKRSWTPSRPGRVPSTAEASADLTTPTLNTTPPWWIRRAPWIAPTRTETPGRQGRHRIRGALQRLRRGRGSGGPASHLRPARTRPDRHAAAQVAGDPDAPIQPRRPGRSLPLRHLHPAGRVLPDPDAGQAGGRADLLRTGHPRQPRHRPTRPGRVDLRPAADAPRETTDPGRFRTRVITEGVTPSP